MSLLWRSRRLRVGFGPERIMLPAGKALDVPDADGGWQAPLRLLEGAFASGKSRELGVVLADHFARYLLLPWSDTLRTPEQWLAFARHRFSGVHGERAAQWDVRVAATAPAGPRLACAVDRALLEELAARCAAGGVRLASVQPFLVAAYNRISSGIRNAVDGGSCWVVVEEPRRLTLVLIQGGAWTAIRSRRCDERWRSELPAILERESAILALAEPCTQVLVCAQEGFDAALHAELRANALSYRELALAAE